ncbi:protein kinase family protein [Clostridium sp. Mt-5]|uniref:Protein kinase family protein n=1 Tax=Clostridium moutaii TaxID=3240932 RepID=A0ABV4BVC8_9CLOT
MERELKKGDSVKFNKEKEFIYIKPLGSGGTGDTHLFKDETTDMLFAFKKYSPKDLKYKEEYYKRFVDEIKILFKLSHKNIVRVYNYYLYPNLNLGYLQMEYIEGQSIDKFNPNNSTKNWNSIFIETISAFKYLEANNVLHRDIRPTNILIDKDENIKIIDFGFGKKLENFQENAKSVFLNWPVSELPNEVKFNKEYNHQTEVYFLGKLFQKLIRNYKDSFKFNHIIEKMINVDPNERYKSFNEVTKAISDGVLSEIDFTENEKQVYINFANGLIGHINNYIDNYNPINDLNYTLNELAQVIHDSALEEFIQNNTRLIRCFINGTYRYIPTNDIKVETIVGFYKLLNNLSLRKQKIVLDNIYTRLSKIKVEISYDDGDIPF